MVSQDQESIIEFIHYSQSRSQLEIRCFFFIDQDYTQIALRLHKYCWSLHFFQQHECHAPPSLIVIMVCKIGRFWVNLAESDQNRSMSRWVLPIFVIDHFFKGKLLKSTESRPSQGWVNRVKTKSTNSKSGTAIGRVLRNNCSEWAKT
jgi:hypothetical protein